MGFFCNRLGIPFKVLKFGRLLVFLILVVGVDPSYFNNNQQACRRLFSYDGLQAGYGESCKQNKILICLKQSLAKI